MKHEPHCPAARIGNNIACFCMQGLAYLIHTFDRSAFPQGAGIFPAVPQCSPTQHMKVTQSRKFVMSLQLIKGHRPDT